MKKIHKLLFWAVAFGISPALSFGQGNVGIGTATPDPSAKLDVVDANKGFLFPRVSLTATNVAAPVTSPANWLVVFNVATAGAGATAVSPGLYYWDNATLQWIRFNTGAASSAAWNLTGNAGTTPATNFIGTTDARDLVIRTNNVERMRVLAGNGVQITSTNFNAAALNPALDIQGAWIRLGDALGNQAFANGMGIKFHDAGVNHASMQYTTATQLLNFGRSGTNGNSLNLDVPASPTVSMDFANLRLGVGTNAPAEAAHIIGNIRSSTLAGVGVRLVGSDVNGTLNNIAAGANGQVLTMVAGAPAWAAASAGWSLTGNAGTVDGTNFIGTTDNVPFNIRTNNQRAGRIDQVNANTYIGYLAGTTTGTNNSGFGTLALTSNTTGTNNTASGSAALFSNTTGSNNTAMGQNALRSNVGGGSNSAFGYTALQSNTSGIENTAIGYESMLSNTTGQQNSAVGYRSLRANTTGQYNNAFGNFALSNTTTAQHNTAVGYGAMTLNTIGGNNVGVGSYALNSNSAGIQNVALGYYSLYNTTANSNVAIGAYAAQTNTTGTNNTAIGDNAGNGNTTGSSNVFVGNTTGNTNTTGSNNTLVGSNANVGAAALTNATAIGQGAIVGASNSLVLGNNANVGIGISIPTQKLHVAGGSVLTDRAYAASTGVVAANTAAFTTGANAVSQVQITDNASAVANGALTYGATAIEGQYLWITNSDAQAVPFTSTTPTTNIAAGATMGFVYTGGAWRAVSAAAAAAADWGLLGNTGTNAATNFIGTTDNQALEIRVNNTRVMRYIPNATSPIVLGGFSGNTAAVAGATIAGGGTAGSINSVTGTYGTVGGGHTNTAGLYSTVAGGYLNNASGQSSTISGGLNNNTTDQYSAIIGGQNLTLSGFGSFGYNSGSTTGGVQMSVAAGNTGVMGNVNLWLANTDNNARELRFYEAQSTAPAFPAATTNYTAFKAQAQAADITYQLPAAAPTVNGQVLTSTTAGVMSWQSAGAGWGLTGNAGTVDGTNFIGTTDNVPFNFRVNNTTAGRIGVTSAQGTFYGYRAGASSGSAIGNTAVGFGAMAATTGTNNTAVGNNAMATNTTGANNVAIGANALDANLSGADNTAIGTDAMSSNISGVDNVVIGKDALKGSSIGQRNIAIGNSTLLVATGNDNVALGHSNLIANTSGINNVAVGSGALPVNTTGSNSVAIGNVTLRQNTTGARNVAVGSLSGGNVTSGTENIFLGIGANISNGTFSNSIAIGANTTVNAANKVRIGNATTAIYEVETAWIVSSDRNLKKNIEANTLGLDFIRQLRPVTYEYKAHEKAYRYTGLIAQEVEETLAKMRKESSILASPSKGDGSYGIRYAELTIPLIQSVQEQQTQIETLQKENAELKARLDRIEKMLSDKK